MGKFGYPRSILLRDRPYLTNWMSGALVTVATIALLPLPGWTQLLPDDTLGAESSVVNVGGAVNGLPADLIEGGAGRGGNLFHSFREFNVGTGQAVYFASPLEIENILTRVTGGNLSNVDGLLGVAGPANLFLLNPNGVIFGPNARLDVGGSVFISTADRLTFADGSEFRAVPSGEELLSMSVPWGVQFNRPQGDLISTGSLTTGQDLTLIGNNVVLEGQVSAGNHLNVQGADTVTMRDLADTPFIASAGNALTVQGDRLVDIAALSHPDSGLFSGDDLQLRSDHPVIGDAHFYAGGDWRVETTTGAVGSLISPNDPVILASGDVTLGNYSGASLHILAGGSVNLGAVTITGTGPIASTINPNNLTPFNGSRTFADLANVNLTEYQAILNADGSVNTVVPVTRTITVDGSTQPTLDVRAGVDWAVLGGLPTSPVQVGSVAPSPLTTTASASRADITVTGDLRITQPDGLLLLTNQYSPNGAPGAIAIVGPPIDLLRDIPLRQISNPLLTDQPVVDLDELDDEFNSLRQVITTPATGNGGDINLYGRGDINIRGTQIRSSGAATGGAAGDIAIASNAGNVTITNSNLPTASASSALGTNSTIPRGRIAVSTNEGDLTIRNSFLGSFSDPTEEVETVISSVDSGEISFTTNTGNITLDRANLGAVSTSLGLGFLSPSAVSGQDAAVLSLFANTGNIDVINSDLISTSVAFALSFADFGFDELLAGFADLLATFDNSALEASGLTDLLASLDSQIPSSSAGGRGGASNLATNSGNVRVTNSAFLLRTILVSIGDTPTDGGNGGPLVFSSNTGDLVLDRVFVDASTTTEATSLPDLQNLEGAATTEGFININIEDSEDLGVAGSADGTTGSLSVDAITGSVVVRGGEVSLSTNSNITLTDSVIASLAQGNLSSAQAGIIRLENGRVVKLDNTSLSANTAGVSLAGDIEVNNVGVLLLRNGSLISSDAGGNVAGGNILINSDFVIAGLNENNDIIAVAFEGRGGQVLINAVSILGLTSSGEPRLQVLRARPTNDTSAGSQFGEAGIVDLNALVVDPSAGVVELPTNLEDRANQITPGCGLGNADDGNEFVVTGRGGLPPNPNDPLAADGVEVPWVVGDDRPPAPIATNVSDVSDAPGSSFLVEAQGVAVDAAGQPYLVASAETSLNSGLQTVPSAFCRHSP